MGKTLILICSSDGFTNILTLRIYKIECCYSQYIGINKQTQFVDLQFLNSWNYLMSLLIIRMFWKIIQNFWKTGGKHCFSYFIKIEFHLKGINSQLNSLVHENYLVRDIKSPILFSPISKTKKKYCFGPITSFFSLSTAKTEKKLGKTRLVVWCREQDKHP